MPIQRLELRDRVGSDIHLLPEDLAYLDTPEYQKYLQLKKQDLSTFNEVSAWVLLHALLVGGCSIWIGVANRSIGIFVLYAILGFVIPYFWLPSWIIGLILWTPAAWAYRNFYPSLPRYKRFHQLTEYFEPLEALRDAIVKEEQLRAKEEQLRLEREIVAELTELEADTEAFIKQADGISATVKGRRKWRDEYTEFLEFLGDYQQVIPKIRSILTLRGREIKLDSDSKRRFDRLAGKLWHEGDRARRLEWRLEDLRERSDLPRETRPRAQELPGTNGEVDTGLTIMPILRRRVQHHLNVPRTKERVIRRSDEYYQNLAQHQATIGTRGELAALIWERERVLVEEGSEFVDMVEHVSKTRGDGLGYDIVSIKDNEPLYIEVKTTVQGQHAPFLLSLKEWQVLDKGEIVPFHIYRIYEFNSDTGTGQINIINGKDEFVANYNPVPNGYRVEKKTDN